MNKWLAGVGVAAMPSLLMAQSNISNVIDYVDGYRGYAITVGIAVLLYTIGRKVVRKLI